MAVVRVRVSHIIAAIVIVGAQGTQATASVRDAQLIAHQVHSPFWASSGANAPFPLQQYAALDSKIVYGACTHAGGVKVPSNMPFTLPQFSDHRSTAA